MNHIQSGQAFLVHATGSIGTLSFNESARAGGSLLVTTPVRAPQLVQQFFTNLYAIKPDGSAILADGVLNSFGDNYSSAVDGLDAGKGNNTAENLSIRLPGYLLAIERRQPVTAKDTIFLNLTGVRAQPYRFEFNPVNLDTGGITAFLEDNYLHSRTPIGLTGSTLVDFTIKNIAGSYASDRFRIVFDVSQALPVTFTSVKAYEQGSNINVEA